MVTMTGNTSEREKELPALNSLRYASISDRKVIEFTVRNQAFAVDLYHTKEVINQPEITPVPNSSPNIMGITNLRGVITTVIDLKAILSLNNSESSHQKGRVIIIDPSLSHKPTGIMVDDVDSVQTYGSEDIDMDSKEKDRYQSGVIKKTGQTASDRTTTSKLVILLDVQKILKSLENEL